MLLAASSAERLGNGGSAAALLFAGFFCYGFGFGGTIPISEYLWVSYFGRAHIGAIRGVSPTIGPVLVGLGYDIKGSYLLAFLAIIATYLLGALLVAISRAPQAHID